MRKKSIVICEDNPDTQKVLSAALNVYEVLEAVSVDTGLALFRFLIERASPPDLIVLDYLLPDLDAEDVISTLRKSLYYKDIPVLLMSGVVTNVEERARVTGADRYLTKPFPLEEFESKVFELLRLGNQQEKLVRLN